LIRLNHFSTSFPILEALLTPELILTVKSITDISHKNHYRHRQPELLQSHRA
jgi:hypothetical protein